MKITILFLSPNPSLGKQIRSIIWPMISQFVDDVNSKGGVSNTVLENFHTENDSSTQTDLDNETRLAHKDLLTAR